MLPACEPPSPCEPIQTYTCSGFLPEVDDEVIPVQVEMGGFHFRYFARE